MNPQSPVQRILDAAEASALSRPMTTILASYIKYLADRDGAREYECEHPALKRPVAVVAASRQDAEAELEKAVAGDAQELRSIRRTFHTCPECNGVGQIED